MTLQDKDVLAEDADVLVNVNMVDNESYKQVIIQFWSTLMHNYHKKNTYVFYFVSRILIDESSDSIIVVMMS